VLREKMVLLVVSGLVLAPLCVLALEVAVLATHRILHPLEICSEESSYLRLRLLYPSTLGLRVITKKNNEGSQLKVGLITCAEVHLIITRIKWIRTSRLSTKNSLSGG